MSSQAPKTVVRNGQEIRALNIAAVVNIVNAAISNKRVLEDSDANRYIKGVTVTSAGNWYEGDADRNIPAGFIFNTNFISQFGMDNPDTKKLLEDAALAESIGDFEAAHDACREYLNKVTVSFRVRVPNFEQNQRVQATARIVDEVREDGRIVKIMTFQGITPEAAELKTTTSVKKLDLSTLLAKAAAPAAPKVAAPVMQAQS